MPRLPVTKLNARAFLPLLLIHWLQIGNRCQLVRLRRLCEHNLHQSFLPVAALALLF